jgi:F-type H+-transporting ATPase subunit epsilon
VLTLRIITPERALPDMEAVHVTVVAADGELGIRTGHAPVVALLKPGYVLARAASGSVRVTAVPGGVGQVFRDQVIILADAAIPAERVDVAKARTALEALRGTLPPSEPAAAAARRRELTWLEAQTHLPVQVMSRDEMLERAESHARAATTPH